MRKVWLVSIFLIVFLVSALVGEAITITIGEQPPLLTKSGGIVNLVIAEALSRSGYTVTFDWLPTGRILKLLENDSLYVYVTPSNTAGQQNPHINFLSANGVFFYKKKNTIRIPEKIEDLAGKRVGTVTNSPLRSLFEKEGIIVDEGPFTTMFQKLDANRVNFVSTADVGGILTIKQLFPGREDEFDFTSFSYTRIMIGLYVKTGFGNDTILGAAEQGFTSMKKDGTLNRMLQEFFGEIGARRVTVY